MHHEVVYKHECICQKISSETIDSACSMGIKPMIIANATLDLLSKVNMKWHLLTTPFTYRITNIPDN